MEQINKIAKPDIKKASGLLLAISIIFVAANLRAPITSVGPLVSYIRESTGISNSVAGLLTTVPLLAFTFMSPFAAQLARRYGVERVIMCALIFIGVGTLCRSISSSVALFGGTMMIGLSIAVCNVLIPSLVKRDFSNKIGLMTGIYSVSMNICGALASGISVPLARDAGFGWQGALSCWLVLTAVGIICWLPRMSYTRQGMAAVSQANNSAGEAKLWRSPLAWQVTLFMGLQSFIFYNLVAWFPEILNSRGMSSDSAGWMLSLIQFSMLPFTFVVPIIASRMKNQRMLVAITTLLYLLGIGGLLIDNNSLVPLWSVLIGIAGAGSFSLAMLFFTLRTRTTQAAAELSGMAQSVGYLLAAVGPLVFGVIHDATHHWTVSIAMLIVASLLIFVFGMGAARNRFAGEQAKSQID
ncbi:MFS transporter, CP family, cyanate transporter [Paenibacillus catalpae]|uniref:MFS transporter, CP family, cyanate transporter n=1 Tax=Paenibacillus catalpae TaxID=1045775 RepID=A0A1I1VGJ9_9BACL|nr:MFS transporter [Paenibacillus catalpae]SFD81915.1 MFS transporter, CP family, cyanate transporter [Paenibacillus catalpae]